MGHVRDCTSLEIIKRGEIDHCFAVVLSLFVSEFRVKLLLSLFATKSIVNYNDINQLHLELSR